MDYLQKIRRLYNLPKEENFGFIESEILALEMRLQVKLPQELKNYYRAFGKNEKVNYSYNKLLKPEKESGFSMDGYLMIFEENQMVVSWGIKEDDLSLDNPPVWGNSGTEEDPEWYLETNSLADFFLLMAVYNGTLGGLKYNAISLESVDPRTVQLIRETMTPVAEISYEKQKVYTDDFYEVVSLSFEDDDKCSAVFIGTSDQSRFDKILDRIEADWSYTSYEDEEQGDEWEEK
ncbi:hypothetical protein AAW12_24225 [Sphingobacterium sp. Ag1]|uniref:hypothetical protein n=1 Tax=Sphingobacterium sp. Ag1 TaxID=1643451 RepID=UPI000627E36D|nr:hypothetical protein [Sphingobacterium sp. Ag1]KKO89448.1 hypothetical protein AAW12_24225 [Sphingobacterium sp. Ag1]